MAKAKDPTDPIRAKAASYPEVAQGTSCTQSSFKTKSAFLYIGMQGGRYKAMFKLDESLPEAARLAEAAPDDFQVGSTAWVTARFSAEKPLAKRIWSRWLDESYRLSLGAKAAKRAKKASRKRSAKKVKRAAKKATAKARKKAGSRRSP